MLPRETKVTFSIKFGKYTLDAKSYLLYLHLKWDNHTLHHSHHIAPLEEFTLAC
jgi:hypothetical protein